MTRALTALLLFAPLLACKPDLTQPRAWACTYAAADKDAVCTGGWYCGKDDYCHSRETGESIACGDDPDCANGWFCAADDRCHDADAGEDLVCRADSDCGHSWHCGVRERCYDRAVAGEVPCRVDAGDCRDTWRCGIDAVCHPSQDAGSIACRYGVDDDCTDGWRCGSTGACVDPAREELVPSAVVIGAAVRVDGGLVPGQVASLSPPNFDGDQAALIATPGAGVTHQLKLSSNRRVVTAPLAGLDPQRPLVVDAHNGFGFDMSGRMVQWKLPGSGPLTMGAVVTEDDGGTLVTTGTGLHHVDQLRLLPQWGAYLGWAAAFATGGTTFWLVDPNGVAHVSGSGLGGPTPIDDVVGMPNERQGLMDSPDAGPCHLRGERAMNGDVSWSFYRGTSVVTTGPNMVCGFGGSLLARPGDVRSGTGGMMAQLVRGAGNSLVNIVAHDFQPIYSACPRSAAVGACSLGRVSCSHICEAGEDLIDFVPVRVGDDPAIDFACRETSGRVRWWRGTRTAGTGNTDCTRTELKQANLAVEGTTLPRGPLAGGDQPQVPPGGWNRWGVRATGGYELYSAELITQSTPWTLDRVPTLLAASPVGYVVGDSELNQFIDPYQYVQRSDVTKEHVSSVFDRGQVIIMSSRALYEFIEKTDGGEPLGPIGRVDATAAQWVEPIRSTQVRRRDGRPELVLSSGDTLYAAPRSSDGGQVVVPSVITPSAGSPILAITQADYPPDGGTRTAVWVGTRDRVLEAYENPSGRWRSRELSVELPDLLVDVWTTKQGAGRVGLINGTVLSLPSGLTLATAPAGFSGEAQDYVEVCGQPFMIDDQRLWALRSTAGVATWTQVFDAAPDTLHGGRVFDGTQRGYDGGESKPEVVVAGRYGELWRFSLSGCP